MGLRIPTTNEILAEFGSVHGLNWYCPTIKRTPPVDRVYHMIIDIPTHCSVFHTWSMSSFQLFRRSVAVGLNLVMISPSDLIFSGVETPRTRKIFQCYGMTKLQTFGWRFFLMFNHILYYIISYHFTLYYIISFYIILYHIILYYYIILYYIILYYIIYYSILYYITLYYIILYIIVYYIILYYILLYYIILYYIILYYTLLYFVFGMALCTDSFFFPQNSSPTAGACQDPSDWTLWGPEGGHRALCGWHRS